MALLSGLNLTKEAKNIYCFAAAWVGRSTTKAGSFLSSRMTGDFLVLAFWDSERDVLVNADAGQRSLQLFA